jgi:7-carboxy-7-deazaguanine synthase
MMLINEIFLSISGEAPTQGRPTVFIRTQGCPVGCVFCDTVYAQDFPGAGQELSIEAIVELVKALVPPSTIAPFNSFKRVLITGGEPLIQSLELSNLIAKLYDEGFVISVETSGAYDPYPTINRATVVMDWKCPSSGVNHLMDLKRAESLKSYDMLKFVIDDEKDFEEVLRIYPHVRCKVAVSPTQKMDKAALVKLLLESRVDMIYSLQIHKIVWDPNLRGV